MFIVRRRVGRFTEPIAHSPVFEDEISARQWATEYLVAHPRRGGAEAVDVVRIKRAPR